MRFYQLDNDTKKYIKRLNYNGIKTPTDIYSVDQFVRGIKDLGLWSDIICWPLRANQNAGSGTIGYSLGGLGRYNGTLTNGPTWQANGITFDGTNDYITVPFTDKSGYTSHNFGAIASLSSVATTRIAVQAGGPWIGVKGATQLLTVSDDGADTYLGAYTNNTFFAANYDKSGSSYSAYRAGALIGTTTTAVALNSTPLLIGAYTTSILFWSGTISFVHLFNKSLTAGENLSLYNLYKSTLGKGLALP
jgi:hypothetical protein